MALVLLLACALSCCLMLETIAVTTPSPFGSSPATPMWVVIRRTFSLASATAAS